MTTRQIPTRAERSGRARGADARRYAPAVPTRTNDLRAATFLLGAVLAGTTLAGCGGNQTKGSISDQTVPPTTSEPGAQPTRTLPPPSETAPSGTVARASRATIDSFDIASRLVCDPGTDLTVDANYRTTGADHVIFVVNGTEVPASPPANGPFAVPVHCDGSVSTVVLTAVDATGQTTVSAKAILTNATAQGE